MSQKKLENCYNITDIRQLARKRAHKMVFDYIDGGADDEQTLIQNKAAFTEYELLYKVLVGVANIDTSTRLLGHDLAVPFFFSPSAGNRLFHTQGERAVAKIATEINTAYSLSTLASVPMEEISALHAGAKFFQLYVWNDRALVADMLARAKAAGFSVLILTVDLPVHGNRERDPRNGFTIPPKPGLKQIIEALKHPAWTWDYIFSPAISYANLDEALPAASLAQLVESKLYSDFNWQDAEWLLGEWNGPAILKGVIRPDDALHAVKTGFQAIQVSNHGGRQLDSSPAPVHMLENIRDAVGTDVELILDGGIRRGTDILKALALGANAVSFARPYLYGLAAGGVAGVRRASELLVAEIKRDMALLGVRRITEIDTSFVRKTRF